ncbi:MAG: Mu-like prophage major head subunit gpT family protein [Dehalococcoidales bacterium]|nr:Mu-like prophage major head subunit gpT family protein [Dehalococcoidales bacterium]
MPEQLLFAETIKEAERYFTNREMGRQFTDEQIKECVDLLNNAKGLSPHRREFLIREALTTSDFPYLFGDVLDRQVLAAYKAVDPVWKLFTRSGKVPRIYPQTGGYRFAMTGGDQYLAEVAEKGEYLASERTETRYPVYVKKYGRQFDISWEALVNDDLGALQDTPERFARAAIRTEHRLVSGVYVADLVAAANLYAAGNANSGALPLTIANLENSIEAMMAFVDANGEPIMNRPKYLVVGPGLEFTARQILTSTTKMWVESPGAGAAVRPFPTSNVVSQFGLELVVDPYIPIYAPNAVLSWFLFADPKDIAAMETDRLIGHENPEICMKASDKVAISGAPMSPMSGDFATDNVFYRVRDVFGCNRLDWRATYGQLSNV